jgi:hypothetical protein
MFRDNTAHWPEPPLSLGKYLGPSIDVGGSLCATILKGNDEWVDRTTFSRVYEVLFPDGRTEEVAANVIAQALYSQP